MLHVPHFVFIFLTLYSLAFRSVFFSHLAVKSFGIIFLLSIISSMFGFVTYYKSLKIIGLNFLAIESNNFRFICPHSLVLL